MLDVTVAIVRYHEGVPVENSNLINGHCRTLRSPAVCRFRGPRKIRCIASSNSMSPGVCNCASQYRGSRVLLPLRKRWKKALSPADVVRTAINVGNRDITMIDSDQPVITPELRVEEMEAQGLALCSAGGWGC